MRTRIEGPDYQPAVKRGDASPGAIVHELRLLQGMTQAALAKATGLQATAISAIEAGRVELGVDRAKKLARVLRVHPAVILFADWGCDEEAAGASRGRKAG